MTNKTLWEEVHAASPVFRNLENEHEIISMTNLNQYKRTDYQTYVTMVTISRTRSRHACKCRMPIRLQTEEMKP